MRQREGTGAIHETGVRQREGTGAVHETHLSFADPNPNGWDRAAVPRAPSLALPGCGTGGARLHPRVGKDFTHCRSELWIPCSVKPYV